MGRITAIAAIVCFILIVIGCRAAKDLESSDQNDGSSGATTKAVSSIPEGVWPQLGFSSHGQRVLNTFLNFAPGPVHELPFEECFIDEPDRCQSSPVVGVNNGRFKVYILTGDDLFGDAELVCVDALTMEEDWRYQVPTTIGIKSNPAVGMDGTVYFIANSVDGGLYALDPNNPITPKWTVPTAALGIQRSLEVAPVIWDDDGVERVLIATPSRLNIITPLSSGPPATHYIDVTGSGPGTSGTYVGLPAVSPTPVLIQSGAGFVLHNLAYILKAVYSPQGTSLQLVTLDLDQDSPYSSHNESDYYPGQPAAFQPIPLNTYAGEDAIYQWLYQPAVDDSGRVFVSVTNGAFAFEPLSSQPLPGWPLTFGDPDLIAGNPAITQYEGVQYITLQIFDSTTVETHVRMYNVNGTLGKMSNSYDGRPTGSPCCDAHGNVVVNFGIIPYVWWDPQPPIVKGSVRAFEVTPSFMLTEKYRSSLVTHTDNTSMVGSPAVIKIPDEATMILVIGGERSSNFTPVTRLYSIRFGSLFNYDTWDTIPILPDAVGNQIALGYDEDNRRHIAWTGPGYYDPPGSETKLHEAIETGEGSKVFIQHVLDSLASGSFDNLSIMIDQGHTGVSYVRETNVDQDLELERLAAYAYWNETSPYGSQVTIDNSSEQRVPSGCRLISYNEDLYSYWDTSGQRYLDHRGSFNQWNSTIPAGNTPTGWTEYASYIHPNVGTWDDLRLKTAHSYDTSDWNTDGLYYSYLNYLSIAPPLFLSNETHIEVDAPELSYGPLNLKIYPTGISWFNGESVFDPEVTPIIAFEQEWVKTGYGHKSRSGWAFPDEQGNISIYPSIWLPEPDTWGGRVVSCTDIPQRGAVFFKNRGFTQFPPEDEEWFGATYFDYNTGAWQPNGAALVLDDETARAADSTCLNDKLTVVFIGSEPGDAYEPPYGIYLGEQSISD